MPEPLSELERDILDYLVAYLRQHTYQPSIREIGREFGLASTKRVSELLDAIAKKGWIERDRSRSRGVRLLGLDLRGDTTTVPWVATDPAADHEALELDRRLAGDGGAFLMPMPDDSLAADGIRAGDLLLVEPLAASQSADEGDLVVVGDTARSVRRYWRGARATPAAAGDAASARAHGRVLSVVRRLRAPCAPRAAASAAAQDHAQPHAR